MRMIPLDLVTKILCRSSVEDLLRFRCLSKWECSLIDSSEFIRLHLNNSNSSLNIVVSSITSHSNNTVCLVDLNSINDIKDLDYDTLKKNASSFFPVGSCNGLITLQNVDGQSVLFNPSIKEYRVLPKLDYYTTDYETYDGFGYDAVSDDYKLVRMFSFNDEMFTKVAICSSNSNPWRWLETTMFHYYPSGGDTFGTLISGALHWLVISATVSKSEYKEVIIAFDLTNEKFGEVSEPDIKDKDVLMEVGNLRGSLCFTCYYNNTGKFEVWIMKEYGLKEPWMKLFSLQLEEAIKPLFFMKAIGYVKEDGKALILRDFDHYDWYDLEKQKMEKFQCNRFKCIFNIITHTKSLVSTHTKEDVFSKKTNKKEVENDEAISFDYDSSLNVLLLNYFVNFSWLTQNYLNVLRIQLRHDHFQS